MSPLIQYALDAIESDDAEVVGEGFLTLAEVVAVNRIQNFRSDIIPEANNEILELPTLDEIRLAVRDWIERNPDHVQAGAAFWVLDKFRDESLLPFLRQWLERYVHRIKSCLPTLGQILVDLDSLGEPAISDKSYSVIEHGKNLDDAIRYLNSTRKEA